MHPQIPIHLSKKIQNINRRKFNKLNRKSIFTQKMKSLYFYGPLLISKAKKCLDSRLEAAKMLMISPMYCIVPFNAKK